MENFFGLRIYSPYEIFSDKEMKKSLENVLKFWIKYLAPEENNKDLVSSTIKSCEKAAREQCKNRKNDANLDIKLIDEYEKRGIVNSMHRKLGKAKLIKSYAEGSIPSPSKKISFADIGAGVGEFALEMKKAGYNIRMQDIKGDGRERRLPEVIKAGIPYDLNENTELPSYKAESFSITSLLTVMHHVVENNSASPPITPEAVFKSAVNITKKNGYILVHESVFGIKKRELSKEVYEKAPELYDIYFALTKEQQAKYACFMDWFLNKLSFRNNAYVPCNFNTSKDWEELFASNGTKIVEKRLTGFDILATPEFHVFYVLQKK